MLKQITKEPYVFKYKRLAIQRGYSFDLTKEEFTSFLKETCYYCGKEPSSLHYNSKYKHDIRKFVYNGIDRKNNDLGYSIENCVTCCGSCNRMKMAMSMEEFLTSIKNIFITLKLGEENGEIFV